MKRFSNILMASLIMVAATIAEASTLPAVSQTATAIMRSDDFSAQRRHAPAVQTRPYRGFADPSFGPDGRPYPVPEYLRNQCYIDMGYGRFQGCSSRG